ncbi:MAG: universal stress protein [Chloroflexota bacterium]
MSEKTSGPGERVYRSILVPLDGSEAAESVLELARNLAVRSGAAVTLLHVCRPGETDRKQLHSAYIERAAELMQRDIAKLCDTVACFFRGGEATAVPVLKVGEPAAEILSCAREIGASIILMTTHGRTGTSASLMSDITNRVMRTSPIPVWLIRTLNPNEIVCVDWPPKQVLLPLDGSDRAEKVMPYARAYAQLFGAEMVLLRVCDQPDILADYPEGSMSLSWDEHVGRVRDLSKKQCSLYLNEVAANLNKEGLKTRVETLLGSAAEEIIKYVGNNRCDLVAMTTFGRSRLANWTTDSMLGRLFFSDVTERVLAASSRGILLVRGD